MLGIRLCMCSYKVLKTNLKYAKGIFLNLLLLLTMPMDL
jgi:hypothetical protein